jgi:hypothetical protein
VPFVGHDSFGAPKCDRMSYGRASAKLSEGIEAMATSAQPIQQRLALAYMFHLASLEPDELPLEVESQFKELKDKLTRIQGSGIGAIVATTNAMSVQDAVGIAKEIVHISHVVDAELRRVELLDQRVSLAVRRHT